MEIQTRYHHLIDIHNRTTYPAEIKIQGDHILSIQKTEQACTNYILPGFIDAHVHIESSMLIPSEFARLAVQHGTVATVSDPHEIANVCGIAGINYMIHNAAKVPFQFYFGAPSCVPATSFETSGAIIDSNDIETLLRRQDIYYLTEMMNYPGVLFQDEEVMKKIALAKKYNKPIDGHAPGLRGEKAKQYIEAGITTDHECVSKEEALDKLKYGMHILIREGSAAKNFDALIDLLPEHKDKMMFCCDDKHPDELMLHHINRHVKMALDKHLNLYDVLQVACMNPVLHYNLDIGLLREKDKADFIVIDDIDSFQILETVIHGDVVYKDGIVKIKSIQEELINQFNCEAKTLTDFEIPFTNNTTKIPVIEAIDGQLITRTFFTEGIVQEGKLVCDTEQDILKIVVVNRYQNAPIAKAFIKNFNLKRGAIASTVAHDSHNIICVGSNDEDMLEAVNALIHCQGGIVVVNGTDKTIMPLPVGGLMSNEPAEKVAAMYSLLDQKAKELGSNLRAPFMTLSFMALLVIPQLKLSDKGLFDGEKFSFVDWG